MKHLFNYSAFSLGELKSKGAWLYGQEIAMDLLCSSIDNVTTPQHFSVQNENEINSVAEKISTTSRSYSVKYSLRGRDSFSYAVKRGANSSRGRKLDVSQLSNTEIISNIIQFHLNAPDSSSSLIFQEFIDQTGGCLFHTEFSAEENEVDLLWENSTARAYALFQKGGLVSYEEIDGPGEPDNREVAAIKIANITREIYDILEDRFGQMLWSIEGFWRPDIEEFIILQLRPTPQDKPEVKLRARDDATFSTHFFWGDFDCVLDSGSNIFDETGIFVRKTPDIYEFENPLIERLSQGKKTLLIDPYKGFCLSHERWFLPEPSLRQHFGFIHIPEKMLQKSTETKLNIYSSANTAHVAPLPK